MSARQRHLVVVGLAIAMAALLLAVAVLNGMLPDVGSHRTIAQCRQGETPSTHLCYEPG